MKARKKDSDWDWELTKLCQPSSAGIRTPCPRLETGNSSDTPCRNPMMMAWRYVIDACTHQR